MATRRSPRAHDMQDPQGLANGFYGWLQRPVFPCQQTNSVLTTHIRSAFVASRKRLARLMRKAQTQLLRHH